MAKNKVKAKVVIHKTKKKVDWPAAGHKAWLTRLRNKKNGKAPKKAQAKTKKPQVKKPVRHVAQGVGFGKYRVNKIALVNALTEDKRKELKPTEVVQLTWNVIKGANGNVSGANGNVSGHNEKAKRKQ